MDGMVSAAQVRERLAEVVNRAAFGKERVILARRGKAVAAIVSLEDVELLRSVGGPNRFGERSRCAHRR